VLEGHVLGGLLDPTKQLCRRFQPRLLGTDQAQDHCLPLRHEPQRFEPAGPLAIVLQQEAVHLEGSEQLLSDRVVPALGEPATLTVAPADVKCKGHAVTFETADGGIVGRDRFNKRKVRIDALFSHLSAHVAVNVVRILRGIQLDIRDAFIGKAADFAPDDGNEFSEQIGSCRIDGVRDSRLVACQHEDGGTWNGHLDGAGSVRFQEAEFVRGDPADLAQLAAGDNAGLFYLQAGYYLGTPIGVGNFQPYFRYEMVSVKQKSDTNFLSGGLNYYLKGHNAKVSLDYTFVKHPDIDDQSIVTVQFAVGI